MKIIQLPLITGTVLMSIANGGYMEKERARGKQKLKRGRAQHYHHHYYYQFSMDIQLKGLSNYTSR